MEDTESFDDSSMEDMESLLDQQELEFRAPRRGEVIEGIVMETGRDGVLVDIGSKSEGLIPLNEMHSLGADPLGRIKRGDELLVYVLQPESSEGQVLLSVDRARGEQGWRTLQKRFEDGESFEGEVTGYNKGGLLVNVEGVNAFVPLSQVVGARPDRDENGEGGGSFATTVGRMLRLKVIEINRRRNRVILSERAALQEWRSQQKDRLLSELHEGEIRRGRITSVRPFGVFVDLGGADGLVHLSELTWERGKTPEEVYHVGDEVDAFVMKVDPDTKKIALSLRRAQPERWDEIVDLYHPGQVVAGRVTKLVTFGAFARIDGPVEGLIHVSELSDRRIQHPREVVDEGDIVPLKIVRIERDKHRIGLSLRQAREDAERQGWSFDNNGSVLAFPEHLRGEIESKLGSSARPPREAAPQVERQDDERREDVSDAREAPAIPAPQPQVQRSQRQQPEAVPPPADDAPFMNTGFAALQGFRIQTEQPADEAPSPVAAETGSVADEQLAHEVVSSPAPAETGSVADEQPVEVDAVEEAPEAPMPDSVSETEPEELLPGGENAVERPEGEITAAEPLPASEGAEPDDAQPPPPKPAPHSDAAPPAEGRTETPT